MVQEKPVASTKEDDKAEAAPEQVAEQKQDIKMDCRNLIAVLEKSVKLKDMRLLMGRVMRQTALIRKTASNCDLQWFIADQLPAALPARPLLLQALEKVSAGHQTLPDALMSSSSLVTAAAHIVFWC